MALRGALAKDVSNIHHPRKSSQAHAPTSNPSGDPGPRTIENGLPAGFARTREGAVAAAVGYLTTGQTLLDMDSLRAESALRQMAARPSVDAQVAELTERLNAARRTLTGGTGPITYRQAAVAVRAGAVTSERATVAVWNVGVLSREGVAAPQAAWAISTFELVWENGDWKIWSESIVPGPAPILNDSAAPATSIQLEDALAGFVSLTRETA